MYKLHHVNFYNISSQIDQYIVKTSSARAYQGPKRQVSRKILISLWAMSTLVPFKLSQSVTYRDVFYIIFSGRKCDYTVCCNSLVRGVATADGNRVAGRLYCHVRKFLAASNFRRLSTKFCWNQNLGGCRYAQFFLMTSRSFSASAHFSVSAWALLFASTCFLSASARFVVSAPALSFATTRSLSASARSDVPSPPDLL